MESATPYFISDASSSEMFVLDNESFHDQLNYTPNHGRIFPDFSISLTLKLYIYVVPVLIFVCLVSFLVNLKILIAAKWLRRPLMPILKISLSMAGADAYTSFLIGTGLFVNSWIPNLMMEEPTNLCPMLILEGLRLGSVISVVFHILFLSIYHYAGIVKPLHYQGIITGTYTNIILAAVWTIPPTSFLVYFHLIEKDGFNRTDCSFDFLKRWNFRSTFFGLFLAPFVVMLYIYMHVFAIVRRHQQTRARFIRAAGLLRNDSTGIRNMAIDLQRNLKAIWTTLLMLGSYLIGWLPGLVYFIIVCDDCYYSLLYFNPITTFGICVVTNLFIILKTLFNPIIYAARISEIKIANVKMHLYLRNLWTNRRLPTMSNQPRAVFRMQDYPANNTEYTDTVSSSRML